jgi:hypothetical protein
VEINIRFLVIPTNRNDVQPKSRALKAQSCVTKEHVCRLTEPLYSVKTIDPFAIQCSSVPRLKNGIANSLLDSHPIIHYSVSDNAEPFGQLLRRTHQDL